MKIGNYIHELGILFYFLKADVFKIVFSLQKNYRKRTALITPAYFIKNLWRCPDGSIIDDHTKP